MEARRIVAPLSEQMRYVLERCAEFNGDALTRDFLTPGSPNVERTSLSRTLRRLRRRGLVRLFMKAREASEPPRLKDYVQRVVLTEAGQRAAAEVNRGA